MKNIVIKFPHITLLVTAIICGLLWRIELEYHGWSGLIWLSYFHFAVPIGFGIFLFWANLFMSMDWKRRALLNLIAVIYGLLMYYGLGLSLTYNYISGPSALLMDTITPEWLLSSIGYSIFLLVPFIPIGAYTIVKVFKIPISFKYLVLAIIVVVLSVPLSTFILKIISHKGGNDFLHSIKSGILIPFWVLSVGLVIVGHKSERQQHIVVNND
jgi:hypothetical protein